MLPVAPVPVITTPLVALPEITLLGSSAVPPIVLLNASLISTPSTPLGIAVVPVWSVPIKLPMTVVSWVPLPPRSVPWPALA